MSDTSNRDLVLYVPCEHHGESSFVLEPPKGRHSFRVLVRCQDSKRDASPKPSSRFAHFTAIVWTAVWRFIF